MAPVPAAQGQPMGQRPLARVDQADYSADQVLGASESSSRTVLFKSTAKHRSLVACPSA